MSDQWSSAPPEEQYVLYAAATRSTLLDLLTDWQPWEPDLDWQDLAVYIPPLAEAIVSLSDRGYVQFFYGPPDGDIKLVPTEEVRSYVIVPSNWWNDDQTPESKLLLTESAGQVPLPQRRKIL